MQVAKLQKNVDNQFLCISCPYLVFRQKISPSKSIDLKGLIVPEAGLEPAQP